MTGWSVHRKAKGYAGSKNGIQLCGTDMVTGKLVRILLDQTECNHLARSIWHAQREYWKKED